MTQAAPRLLLFVLSPALNLPFLHVKLHAFFQATLTSCDGAKIQLLRSLRGPVVWWR